MFIAHDTFSQVIMSCIGRPPNAFIVCPCVNNTRPQIKVSQEMKVYVHIINTSRCLIYNAFMSKLTKFDWRIEGPLDPRIGVYYFISIDQFGLWYLHNSKPFGIESVFQLIVTCDMNNVFQNIPKRGHLQIRF